MQNTINFRGIQKFSDFKLQCGKLFNIFYFKSQHLAIREMIEQGFNF